MKTPNYLKRIQTGIFAVCLLSFGIATAQQTTGDVTKEADIVPGTTITAGAVRVIDNKGTIKYLQSKNGITMLSNTTADITTTTWQLGGTLTDDTFIDIDGNVFALDGLELETGAASTDATDESDAATATGSGYTILVRDEATGETKKLLATDLIQSGQQVFTAAADDTLTYTLTGIALPIYSQVWVYRNGAKLLGTTDYTVSGAVVTLDPSGTGDWAVYANDTIEVQYVK